MHARTVPISDFCEDLEGPPLQQQVQADRGEAEGEDMRPPGQAAGLPAGLALALALGRLEFLELPGGRTLAYSSHDR